MTSSRHEKSSDAGSLFLKAEQYEELGDLRNAFKCLLAGAEIGDIGCMTNLGNFYASGTGVRRNLVKAAY